MNKFEKTLTYLMKHSYILIFLFMLACQNNGNSKVSPPPPPGVPGGPPKFARIQLQYTDTNSPEVKKIIYALDTFYQKRVAAGFNGSVLIGYKGKVLYERYFGLANREAGLAWNKNTPSQLASTSKPFTAVSVCLLKDRGMIRFDDKVSQYIPEFPYPEITIRELLSHRSGLPEYFHFGEAMRAPETKGTLLTNEELVQILATKKPKLTFTPGTRFTYCNTNFAMLSLLVSRVSGMSFPEFMKKMIFEPIGMKNSYVFDANTTHSPNACRNYKGSSWHWEQDMWLDGTTGDKGVYSTVTDMYKWDQALYHKKLIKEKTLEEAYTPYSFEKPGVKNYGLGWRMLLYPNQKIIFHNGWWHGANTCFYRFLDDNFTIIVLGNKYNKSIYYQPQGIFSIINGPGTADNEWDSE
jgi:CubicO group peptidase (beta-lactamase class C family)